MNVIQKRHKKHINDFGNDPVPSLVLRISIPFMFAQFVNVLYSIIDRIYIGNIPEIGKFLWPAPESVPLLSPFCPPSELW